MSYSRSIVVELDNLIADLVIRRYNKAVSKVRKSVTDFNILYLYPKAPSGGSPKIYVQILERSLLLTANHRRCSITPLPSASPHQNIRLLPLLQRLYALTPFLPSPSPNLVFKLRDKV
jgi:hypothetical protein